MLHTATESRKPYRSQALGSTKSNRGDLPITQLTLFYGTVKRLRIRERDEVSLLPTFQCNLQMAGLRLPPVEYRGPLEPKCPEQDI